MLNNVMLLFRPVTLVLLFAMSMVSGAHTGKETGGIELLNASARATLPGMSSSAAYMTIRNGSSESVQIRVLESPVAMRSELPTTEMNNGMMSMRRVDNLQINPGESVELKPGGYHIMLMGLKQPIAANSEIPIIMTFSNGERLTVMARAADEIEGQHMAH